MINKTCRHRKTGHIGKITNELTDSWGIHWYGGSHGDEHAKRNSEIGVLNYWQHKGLIDILETEDFGLGQIIFDNKNGKECYITNLTNNSIEALDGRYKQWYTIDNFKKRFKYIWEPEKKEYKELFHSYFSIP